MPWRRWSAPANAAALSKVPLPDHLWNGTAATWAPWPESVSRTPAFRQENALIFGDRRPGGLAMACKGAACLEPGPSPGQTALRGAITGARGICVHVT
ncbi:hypothetical protein GCM10020220_011020 [Nonomuraea rubra]